MLFLYRVFSLLLAPLLPLYLRYRMRLGKEDPNRFKEKLGRYTVARPEGTLVWLHAASVGEVLSILPLIKTLLATKSNLHFLITTGTITSARLLQTRLAEPEYKGHCLHQFMPLDTPPIILRFLHHWQPNLALWVESEIWPNLIIATARHCKLILVNGRMSEHSAARWKKLPRTISTLLQSFSLCLAQSPGDKERFASLGANAEYLGNLKWDQPPLPFDADQLTRLQQAVGSRPVWLAASTHEGEEAIIFAAHATLKATYPHLLTIIVPRHPERGVTIAKACPYPNARRAEGSLPGAAISIYIADTIGELGLFYRLCPLAFIGGSLIPHGGQNPLEAARCMSAIMVGRYTANFNDSYQALFEHNAALQISDSTTLAAAVDKLLTNSISRDEMASSAQTVATSMDGVLTRVAASILDHIPD